MLYSSTNQPMAFTASNVQVHRRSVLLRMLTAIDAPIFRPRMLHVYAIKNPSTAARCPNSDKSADRNRLPFRQRDASELLVLAARICRNVFRYSLVCALRTDRSGCRVPRRAASELMSKLRAISIVTPRPAQKDRRPSRDAWMLALLLLMSMSLLRCALS